MILHWLTGIYVYQLLPDNLSWSAGQSPLKSVSFVHGYTPPSNKTDCPNKDFIQGSQLSKRATMSNAASPTKSNFFKTVQCGNKTSRCLDSPPLLEIKANCNDADVPGVTTKEVPLDIWTLGSQ